MLTTPSRSTPRLYVVDDPGQSGSADPETCHMVDWGPSVTQRGNWDVYRDQIPTRLKEFVKQRYKSS